MNFILRFLLAVVFFFVGWFSNSNTEYLEYVLVDAGWSGWFISAYSSRILLGSSLAMSLLLLFLPGNPRKIINAAILLSAGFVLLNVLQPLVLELTRCYVCLAEIDKISRYQGIWLWSGIILILILLRRNYTDKKGWLPAWAAWVFLVAGLTMPFILNYPAHWAVYGEEPVKEMHRDLQLQRLDTVQFIKGNHEYDPAVWKQKRLLVLATLTCPYCSRAAYKLHIIKKKDPEFPVTVLLKGDTFGLPVFVKRHVFDNVPYQLMDGPLFGELCEGRVPRIFVVENGIATKELNYWSIEPELP
ncbi:MAG: hypothetical protein R2850_04540 [Bacteroidia bacterium]